MFLAFQPSRRRLHLLFDSLFMHRFEQTAGSPKSPGSTSLLNFPPQTSHLNVTFPCFLAPLFFGEKSPRFLAGFLLAIFVISVIFSAFDLRLSEDVFDFLCWCTL